MVTHNSWKWKLLDQWPIQTNCAPLSEIRQWALSCDTPGRILTASYRHWHPQQALSIVDFSIGFCWYRLMLDRGQKLLLHGLRKTEWTELEFSTLWSDFFYANSKKWTYAEQTKLCHKSTTKVTPCWPYFELLALFGLFGQHQNTHSLVHSLLVAMVVSAAYFSDCAMPRG